MDVRAHASRAEPPARGGGRARAERRGRAASASVRARRRAPRMKLLAISDLHLGHEANRLLLAGVPDHRDDWLIVAGDVGETFAHMELAWSTLLPRFARVFWTPGNHELWSSGEGPRGAARYGA